MAHDRFAKSYVLSSLEGFMQTEQLTYGSAPSSAGRPECRLR